MPRPPSPKPTEAEAVSHGSTAKLIQSENNLLLLRYLAEHGPAPSRKAWAEGALAWIEANGGRNYFSRLLTATHSVNRQLVNLQKVGSNHVFSISDEGRQVLDQRMSVWIRGGGWFSGFGLDLQVRTAKREAEEAVRRTSEMLLHQLETEDDEAS